MFEQLIKERMIISCCICCDILLPDSDLLHLKCGHIFHDQCLLEWMKRSKTCPQCRKKTFRPTRVYPNFTTTSMDDASQQVLDAEKERFRDTLASKDSEIADLKGKNDRFGTDLAAREADMSLLEATMRVAKETHKKEVQNLRNQIIIFEERVNDLLFEISSVKMNDRDNLEKLDQCRLELRNAQIDLNGRMKLIECFERVNEQLQVRQNEIEVENNRLREQLRTLLLSASTKMKRKVAMDEFMSHHQKSQKVVIDLEEDDDDDDDDCVIVTDEPSVTEQTPETLPTPQTLEMPHTPTTADVIDA